MENASETRGGAPSPKSGLLRGSQKAKGVQTSFLTRVDGLDTIEAGDFGQKAKITRGSAPSDKGGQSR